MSTVAPVLEASQPVLDYEARPKGGGLVGWVKGHFAALNDQVLISGTNFITGVLTARSLDKGEFGIFSAVYAVLLLANILQSTLITQAHNVLGSTRKGHDYQRYTTSTGWMQLAICAIEALLVVPLAIFAVAFHWKSAGMLVALIPSIIFWQLQEFVRRVLYTEGRHVAALINDIFSYGGQAALMIALYWAHERGHWPFTGALALYILAVTSGLGVILGVWQLRGSVGKYFERHDVLENWHFGKWLLGGELMGWCSSLHMQVWWAALILGATASADLRAVQILFGPTRVIAFFLGTVLPIRFAKALHEHGHEALFRQMRKVYAVLIPTVGVYCLLMVLFPKFLLKLAYRNEYADAESISILTLYSICAFLSYLQMGVVAALTAARHTRRVFVGSVWGCVIAVIASPVLIHKVGASGSIMSIMLVTGVVTIVYAIDAKKILFSSHQRRRAVGDHHGETMSVLDHEGVVVGEPQPSDSFSVDARGELLMRVLGLLERDGIPYCILHGYQTLPQRVSGDIDMLLPREAMPRRFAQLLRNNQNTLDADVVQWFTGEGAHLIVLASRTQNGQPPAMLQLHVSSDYQVSGRVVFSGSEILRSRRETPAGFYVPSAEVEFASVLANRIDKGEIRDTHARKLSQLWSESPDRCRQQLARLLPSPLAKQIESAAESDDWSGVAQTIGALRTALRRELGQGQRGGLVLRGIKAQLGRLVRWARPRCGLHVVFLGPDGAGKSTVIDAVRERIAPAFLETNYQTFARGILGTQPKKAPHELPVRSLPASLVKAGWWALCYGPGYFAAVYPTKARGGLWINHRYLIDAIVDPERYRYGGPTALVRWIWAISPKPDLIIVLDAPVEVLAKRKNEVKPAQLARLREGYVALAKTLPNAHIISADQPLEQTIGDVTETILSHLSRRTAARRSLR
jgi:O-antigen/teichoic acid export membrane protein